ncbi:MAG: nitroreductase [Actinomycetota bacterium]|nr:nitroreductase [Actinomycetota bacterium]
MNTTLSRDEIDHLVMMATCAPSVHNTQPWLFARTERGLTISADPSRRLTVTDPLGRDLLVSCGAALHHLQVAARAVGIDTDVHLLPPGRDVLADVTLTRGSPGSSEETELAVAILHRHTYRGRFADRPVAPTVLSALRLAAESRHGLVRLVRQDELVEVEVLVSAAERLLLDTDGYPAELARWVWDGPADHDRGDGLPAPSVEHGAGRAESLQGRQFEGVAATRPDEPPPAEHPTVLLLSTSGDSPADQVEAGEALSALLLAATRLGVLAQPIGQVIDVPATRWALRDRLGTVGAPQMLLRLGVGAAVPTTPRRSVEDVFA